jgi:hypothetical protein
LSHNGLGHCIGVVLRFAQDDVERPTMLNRSSRPANKCCSGAIFQA